MSAAEHNKINHLSKAEIINVVITLLAFIAGMAFFFYMEHHMFNAELIAEHLHVTHEAVEHGIAGVSFAIIMLVLTVVFAVINRDLLKKQWHGVLHHKKEVALWAVIGAGLVYVIMTLNHHFIHGPHHEYTLVSHAMAGVFSPILIIGMSFGMAFVEELSYKVCCFLPVEGLPLVKASLVAAVLYGALNGIIFLLFSPHYAVGAFIMYTLLGLKFGLLYYNTHTIFTSIFAGTIYSTITMILMFLA